MLTVDLLYGDHEGGQRTISRFILTREDDDQWRCGVVRHWALDGIDPRVTGPLSANTDERQYRPRGGTLLAELVGRGVDTARGRAMVGVA